MGVKTPLVGFYSRNYGQLNSRSMDIGVDLKGAQRTCTHQ